MKTTIALVAGSIYLLPLLVLGQTEAPPEGAYESLADLIVALPTLFATAKSGEYVLMTLLLIKAAWTILDKFPVLADKAKAKGVEVNLLLAGFTAALTLVLGGGSWFDAGLVLLTGPAAGALHDLGQLIWNLKNWSKEDVE